VVVVAGCGDDVGDEGTDYETLVLLDRSLSPEGIHTQSIMVLVKRMNHVLRVPDLSSPVDSAQPTLPAGYSPPMPIPTCIGVSDGPKNVREGVSYKEPPRRHDVEHADRIAVVVRPSGERGKDDQDGCGEHERVRPRPLVGEISKDELPDDGAGEGDVAEVVLGV
jgi:hypothetical protein